MSHNPRRKKFVDRRVQGALARRLAIQWFACLIVTCATAFILQVCTNPFVSPSEHLRNVWWSHGPLLISVAFLLPVFVLDTIKLSNRFAGPVGRMRSSMQAINRGEPATPITFRKNDFWKEVAEDYNAMLATLSQSGQKVTIAQSSERQTDESEKVLVEA